MVKAKKIIMIRQFEGEPKPSDFRIVEEDLPDITEGEFLCESLWMSVDPYMRILTIDVGSVLPGGVVAHVVESKTDKFPKGKYLVGYFGWRTMTVFNTLAEYNEIFPKPYLLPDLGDLPLSLAVGVLGMPGVTANLAFLRVCNPQPGETVVVNAAAGAVGSVVGQIARLKGCRVIGFAGSDEKIKWLKEELGFHAAYNYKKVSVSGALREAAPNGVDCFFDNVGGLFAHEVYVQMNHRGRVSVCGAIAGYNVGFEQVMVPMPQPFIMLKELKLQGFVSWLHADKWLGAIQENLAWIREGKLVFQETITEGFENAPQAFISLLRGENKGKAVVKI